MHVDLELDKSNAELMENREPILARSASAQRTVRADPDAATGKIISAIAEIPRCVGGSIAVRRKRSLLPAHRPQDGNASAENCAMSTLASGLLLQVLNRLWPTSLALSFRKPIVLS